jgi:VWFA-related protein
MRLTNAALTSLLLTLTLASTRPAPAQDNTGEMDFPGTVSAPQSAAPTIHVYSRETILDVLVTDDKGQPVRGLTQSDFTIEEDNKPQPIRSFYEIDKTTPPPPARTLPPNTYTNSTALPTNGPVQIFLFDLGSPQDQMERAKKYIADYFRSVPAGTQVALFELSPSKGLVLMQGFTTDGRAAAAVVDNLDVEWIRNPAEYEPIAIAGLNQIAAYVAGIRGRKNLIWIIPVPLMIDRDGGYAAPCSGPPDMTYTHRLMDLYDLFTREQIAIYPFDPRGVHELGCPQLKNEMVAEATGGATSNSNDYKSSIAEIVDSTNHFYTLSYVPTRPDEDGHFHPIKITVDRPGLHLSYRPGYNDEQPSPPDAVLKQQMTQGPMRLGAIPATQILFDLHVSPSPAEPTTASAQPASASAPPRTKGVPYTAAFTLDPTQIALTESPDGTRTANIELDLGAFDFYGKLITARSQTFKLTVTPAQMNGFYRKPLSLSLAIDLPRGQLTLRAGIFDTAASKAGTLEVPLAIPKK